VSSNPVSGEVALSQAFQRILIGRPVDRLAYTSGQCAGKKVFDLGCLDETAYTVKQGTAGDYWLHKRIAEQAQWVVGIDNSPLVPDDGLKTFDNAVIVRADVYDLLSVDATLNGEHLTVADADVIVAGELIEHLPNVMDFLSQFTADKLRGKTLIMSTPNATSAYNAIMALVRRESCHEDHIGVYSYKVLSNVMRKCGLGRFRIVPYHLSIPEVQIKSTGLVKIAAVVFERTVHAIEWLFPLKSSGYIVEVAL